jgi:curli biogenesis system outer membrane secretion channel CsgG
MKHLKIASILIILGTLSACATTPLNYGHPGAKTPARGSAGGATAINATEILQHCSRPVGTMAISEEDESAYFKHGERYGLRSPAQSLRLFAQQSNCFVIVERGEVLHDIEREKYLERTGDLRPGSNMGRGQMAAADYTVQPSLVFEDFHAGGTKGGILGTLGSALVGLSGKVEYKDVQAMLIMIDNRSGVQVSIAEGSARGVDKDIFIGGLTAPLSAGFIESYARTHQDKIIVGAYLDAFNNLVSAVNNYRPQQSAGPNGHGTGGSLLVN